MFSIKKKSGGEYLYEGTRQVEFARSPHKWNGWRSKPKFLIIHYTAAGSYTGSVNWFKNPGCNYPPPGGVVSGRDGTLNGLKGSCACKASGIHNGA